MRLENDFGWEEFRVSEAREQKGLLGAGCWAGKTGWGRWLLANQHGDGPLQNRTSTGVGRREFKWPGVQDVPLVIG